ncbi:hypothetical protein [Methanorbis furvi]|uniref:Uncharacterized protein n=1 Tax=Methanorbis furvi TaxID=3028299 RepID=A0AAE4MCU0_9EURY|nr:hypothetical protein [Methanocorpusculaceae archaeon Ag1]
MLTTHEKLIYSALLFLGIFSVGIALCDYHAVVGSSPELSHLYYLIGIVLGFITMLWITQLYPREPKNTNPLTPFSYILAGGVILILLAAIIEIANLLMEYLPEKGGFSVYMFSCGFMISVVATMSLYCLMEYLPRKKNNKSEIEKN